MLRDCDTYIARPVSDMCNALRMSGKTEEILLPHYLLIKFGQNRLRQEFSFHRVFQLGQRRLQCVGMCHNGFGSHCPLIAIIPGELAVANFSDCAAVVFLGVGKGEKRAGFPGVTNSLTRFMGC